MTHAESLNLKRIKSNIHISFSVKLPSKSLIMALTKIIHSMLVFSEKGRKGQTMPPLPSSPCYIWTIPFRAALDTQPANRPGLTSSLHLVHSFTNQSWSCNRWIWQTQPSSDRDGHWAVSVFLAQQPIKAALAFPAPNICACSYEARSIISI